MLLDAEHAIVVALDESIRGITQRIALGQCQSLEQYKALCGRIAGLGEAQEIVHKVLAAMAEDEDEQ